MHMHLWSYLAQFFLEWEMFQTNVVEKMKMHYVFNNLFFRKLCRCDVTSKNIIGPDRQQMTIWRTRIACWIHKATNTHLECVILIPSPTATVDARTRLNVVICTLPVSFILLTDWVVFFLRRFRCVIMPSEFNFRQCWWRRITSLIWQ
jgi:hypothetical protein